MTAQRQYIAWFSEVGKEDLSLVGGKGANLGEMTSFGVPVPDGFIVTVNAYFDFLKENNLTEKLKKILQEINVKDLYSYTQVSQKAKKEILEAKIPKEISIEIMKAYLKMGKRLKHPYVAIRSSATAEDLPEASFAGQQATFLNIKGEANVVRKVHACWASLFEARAIFYRRQHKIDHLKVGIAVPVQKMIQSETSGVMFTINPVTNEKDQVLIEGIWGLGELIVKGTVTPDRYLVRKKTFKIIKKITVSQKIQLIKQGTLTKQTRVQNSKQNQQKLTSRQIVELAKLGDRLQKHYFFPQDIEWAIEKGKIYIIQTRPVTTLRKNGKDNKNRNNVVADKQISPGTELLLTGIPASPGLVTGKVRVIHKAKDIGKIKKGEVLVTSMTTPDFVPAMKRVAAIVTDKGGQTSHAAIVSRELGVSCVVGTEKATKILKTGQYVTVKGKTGEIFKALPRGPGKNITLNLSFSDQKNQHLMTEGAITLLETATKVYVNLAEPDLAGEVAKKKVDGVGLLRAEFMIADIGVHPKKLIKDKKSKVFVEKLSKGLQEFCRAFGTRPVIYRASDFKTNEYRNLAGGKAYEPEEANPMLGYRGAYRYLSDPAVFHLELQAIKKVRQKGFRNLHLMIPFVHQPWELLEVKKMVGAAGLLRSSTFKLWMMVEIPSNVILLDEFIKQGIDGVSIGSNDLTMLLLGVDRDNSEVAPVFNERDPAVLWALEKVIKTCHKYKITSSICGQAPTVYPELLEKLVSWGITSVSVNPDVIGRTRQLVYEAEHKRVKEER